MDTREVTEWPDGPEPDSDHLNRRPVQRDKILILGLSSSLGADRWLYGFWRHAVVEESRSVTTVSNRQRYKPDIRTHLLAMKAT